MRRNMALILKILEYVERELTAERLTQGIPYPRFRDHRHEEVQYHVELCHEAGYLVRQHPHPQLEDDAPTMSKLTWKGHEALDAWRRDGRQG